MSLSVKDFKAPEYNLLSAVFRLMPSNGAISNGTGASGKDNIDIYSSIILLQICRKKAENVSTGVVCGIRNPEFGIRNLELVYFKEFGIRNWCILRNLKH